MTLLLSLLPLVAVVALLASGRASLLRAGLVGLVLAIPAVARALPPGSAVSAYLLREAAVGAWIAWPAVAVIFAGLTFHSVAKLAPPASHAAFHEAGQLSHRRLFAACFLLGPFAESVTGFGVGSMIAIAVIVRMGVRGPAAAVFALFSQILVPWGALAIGTVLGAALIHLPAGELGACTALVCGPLLFGYLGLFWYVCARQGMNIPGWQRLDDTAWVAALAVGLHVASRIMPPETAGLSATGVLLVLRFLRDEAPSGQALRRTARGAAPFILLTICLVLTRVMRPLTLALGSRLVLQPAPDLPAFPVLFHVSSWLCIVAAGHAVLSGRARALPQVLASTWKSARVPAAVTLVFVVMAQWMSGAGISASLAQRWGDLAGSSAVLATPLFSAVAGFLTGSIVASNGMMLPLGIELSARAGVSPLWVAAVQNMACGAATMISPIRIGMVAAAEGIPGEERAIYREITPLGPMVLGVLTAAALLVAH